MWCWGKDDGLRNKGEGLEKMFRKITEEASLYDHLERTSTSEILVEMNREDQRVATAVKESIPQVERLVDSIFPRMKSGGRVFYVGAGTSGRLGVLDASEIPPTYGLRDVFIAVIAGGDKALRTAVEKAEDIEVAGWNDLLAYHPDVNDTVIGIAASGTTPYVVGALKEARNHGLLTACITSNPDSPVTQLADIAVVTVVGPEYVTGSSRMKSGTATKLVLNMLSTTLMIKLGRVEGNRMVNLQPTNRKLTERSIRMLMERLNVNEEKARQLLLQYGTVKAVLECRM